MTEEKKVDCASCGHERIGELDAHESEKDCQRTAKKPCDNCGCPFIKEDSK